MEPQNYQIPEFVVREVGALQLQLAAARAQITLHEAELERLRAQLNGHAELAADAA